MEKRRNKRLSAKLPLVWQMFNAMGDTAAREGTLVNYNRNGMHAQLSGYVKKGTILVVRTVLEGQPFARQPIGEGFRSLALVQVRWVKPLPGQNSNWYGVGLKYL